MTLWNTNWSFDPRRHRPTLTLQPLGVHPLNCPKCDAWSRVLSTREKDEGHRRERRHECANGHRFVTQEVHSAVWCSAKARQGEYRRTVGTRAALARRNREIQARLAAGEVGRRIAESLGVSESLVSLVARGRA
jgi:hypothetical protein